MGPAKVVGLTPETMALAVERRGSRAVVCLHRLCDRVCQRHQTLSVGTPSLFSRSLSLAPTPTVGARASLRPALVFC